MPGFVSLIKQHGRTSSRLLQKHTTKRLYEMGIGSGYLIIYICNSQLDMNEKVSTYMYICTIVHLMYIYIMWTELFHGDFLTDHHSRMLNITSRLAIHLRYLPDWEFDWLDTTKQGIIDNLQFSAR